MDPILTPLVLSALWAQCSNVGFAAGIVGNLLAGLGYDHLVKPGVAGSLIRLRQLVASGITEQNHDLLRAIWMAQNRALVLVCEDTLSRSKGLRPGSLAIPEDFADFEAWISPVVDGDVKRLLRLRAQALRAAGRADKADLEIVRHAIAAGVDDMPALLQAGKEIGIHGEVSTDDLPNLRKRVTDHFLIHIHSSLPKGVSLPFALERALTTRWFDYLRTAFRETLKNDVKAKTAFELHIWERIEGLPVKLDQALSHLAHLDRALDQVSEQVRWLVQAVESTYHQLVSQRTEFRSEQEALLYAIDRSDAVRTAEARLSSMLSAFRERMDFYHRDFLVRPVQIAKRLPGESLDVFLLRPEARAIPLIGRTREVGQLWKWVHRPDPVSLCVMGVGPGAGKTRLGFELLLALQRQKNGDAGQDDIREEGHSAAWRIGRVSIDTLVKFDEIKDWGLWRWDRPTVLMVDDALGALGPLVNWLRRIVDCAREAQDLAEALPPLRLLLIERPGAAEHLRGRLRDVSRGFDWFFPSDKPMQLSTLDTPELRLGVFSAGIRRVAKEGGEKAPRVEVKTKEFTEALMADVLAQPLYLIMAAWETVRCGSVLEALRLSRNELVAGAARREHERIGRLVHVDDSDKENKRKMVRHLISYATLCGGFKGGEALAVAGEELAATGRLRSFDPPDLVDRLTTELGKGPACSDIIPIRPGIVGERVVFDWLSEFRIDQERMELLTRCARRNAQTFRTLFQMKSDLDAAASDAVAGWLHAVVAHWDDHEPGLLERISDALRYEPQWVALAADVSVRLVQQAQKQQSMDSDDSRSRLAGLMIDAAERLLDAGQEREAAQMNDEAVKIARELYARCPELYGRSLARALDNRCALCKALKRDPEALAMREEVVRIYHKLYEDNPELYGKDLTRSLHWLWAFLLTMDRKPEEVLEVIGEAVKTSRELYERNPEVYGEDLKESLGAMAGMLKKLDRGSEALTKRREAVKISRELVVRNRGAFGICLVSSLHSLMHLLSELNRKSEALEIGEEAVKISRELYALSPQAFGNNLVTSLHHLRRLLRLDRAPESLQVLEEGVKISRELYAYNPDSGWIVLVGWLNSLGIRLSELDRIADGLELIEEAVKISREQYIWIPWHIHRGLVRSLGNLGRLLSELDRKPEALEAYKEAVKVSRELNARNPRAYDMELVRSLNKLGISLISIDRMTEALEVIEEAVKTSRELYEREPRAYARDLARSLDNLGSLFSKLNRETEALSVREEVTEISRERAARGL